MEGAGCGGNRIQWLALCVSKPPCFGKFSDVCRALGGRNEGECQSQSPPCNLKGGPTLPVRLGCSSRVPGVTLGCSGLVGTRDLNPWFLYVAEWKIIASPQFGFPSHDLRQAHVRKAKSKARNNQMQLDFGQPQLDFGRPIVFQSQPSTPFQRRFRAKTCGKQRQVRPAAGLESLPKAPWQKTKKREVGPNSSVFLWVFDEFPRISRRWLVLLGNYLAVVSRISRRWFLRTVGLGKLGFGSRQMDEVLA